jgi:hypothetical protein
MQASLWMLSVFLRRELTAGIPLVKLVEANNREPDTTVTVTKS